MSAMEKVSHAACVACGCEVHATRCTHCGAALRVRGYVVQQVLSEQPYSRVYRAAPAEGPSVVLKELAFSLIPNAQTLEAFHREAALLRQLTHPQLPTFLDAFQEGSGVETRLYLAMTYVEGRSLQEELEAHRFNEAEALEVAAQGLELLVYLHGLSPPLLHRDIKPANLLRRPDGSLALVDFGAARDVQRTTARQSTLVGTVGYMPPEQLLGVTTPGSDVYALGATLVHLLSRVPPGELMGEGMGLDFQKRVNVRKPTLDFLLRLVHPKPRRRFATAAQALEALQAVRSGRTGRRRLLLSAARVAGLTGALVAGAFVLQPQLESALLRAQGEAPAAPATPQASTTPPAEAAPVALGGADTPLRITCPAGTVLAEDGKKRMRWCSRTSASGHQIRHGPFVSWDSDGDLVERSSYVEDKLHGLQLHQRDGAKAGEGEYAHGKKTGLWIIYDAFAGSSRKQSEQLYVDGELEGPARLFDHSGRLENEGSHQKGQKHGVWVHYESGRKANEATYVEGKLNGPFTSWHDHPSRVEEQGAFLNGERTGPWVKNHSNGKQASEGAYDKNRQEGEWRTWHENGTLASQGSFLQGSKTGPWTTWFSNGQKESEGTFEQGEPTGLRLTWYETGAKHTETLREAGLVKRVSWYPNGKMESRGQERDRNTEGLRETWHLNGKKKSTGTFLMGREQGRFTSWHDNGRKESEGVYEMGQQKGVWRWWDASGKTMRVETILKRW